MENYRRESYKCKGDDNYKKPADILFTGWYSEVIKKLLHKGKTIPLYNFY